MTAAADGSANQLTLERPSDAIDASMAQLLKEIGYMTLEMADEEPEPYVIDGLLSKTATVLAAPPKAGKTNLGVGMVSAVMNGEAEFVGQAVVGSIRNAAWGLSDAGAVAELRSRFGSSALRSRNRILNLRKMRTKDQWERLAKYLVADGVDLYVHDNFLGGLGDEHDSAEARTSQHVVEMLRSLVDAGIAVLVITHTPKGRGEGLDTASAPLGGRALAAFARSIIAMRKNGTLLKVESNLGPNLSIPLHVRFDGDVPTWERGQEKSSKDTDDGEKPAGRTKRMDKGRENYLWAQAIGWAVAESHAKSNRKLASELVAQWSGLGSPDAVRHKLPHFVRKDGLGGWSRVTE